MPVAPIDARLCSDAHRVHKRYALCDHCTGRVFSRRARASDHARLGRKIREAAGYAEPKKCHVCKGTFAQLGASCDEMVRLTEGIEFSTFLIGATLRPSMLDADDDVRARYKMRGMRSAKSDVTATLSRMFARHTHARATSQMPDVMLHVDLQRSAVGVETRPVFVQARYTKASRGVPQKGKRCSMCDGRGCMRCAHRGIVGTCSVEEEIGTALCDVTGARQAKFLWCGSEDPTSIVTGRGRPMFVRLVCPSRRSAALPKRQALGNGVSIHGAKYVDALPKTPPKFTLTATVRISTESEIDAKTLRVLRSIAGSVTDYGAKRQSRAIHAVSYRRLGAREFQLRVRVDGGFPLRRFVESSNVSPNITDLLETESRYVVADFADVDLWCRRARAGAKS